MIDKPDNNETDIHQNKHHGQYLNRKPRGAGFALFIASLALFFAAAGIAAGYKHWQRMHDRAKDNARQIKAIEMALPSKTDSDTLEKLRLEITENAKLHQATTEKNLKQMAEMRTQTEQFAQTVTSQVEQITSLQARLLQDVAPANEQDWQIAEVTFLLKVASRELHLSENQDAAKSALKEADQRLSEIGSVTYLPVRQQISREIAALDSIQITDITSLSGKINDLMIKLKPVQTTNNSNTAALENPQQDTEADTATPESLLSGYKTRVLDTISDAVIVRRTDNPIAASLSAEAREHLYRLIQLRMESLRLMALQQHDEAYQAQIRLLQDSIKNYYPTSQSSGLLASLDELSHVNLKPDAPDISGSLHQLKKTRQADLARASQ